MSVLTPDKETAGSLSDFRRQRIRARDGCPLCGLQPVRNISETDHASAEQMQEQTIKQTRTNGAQARDRSMGPGGPPPRAPVDISSKHEGDDNMELRITRLEGFADDCRKDIRTVDVRLARIETQTDVLTRNSATKSDIAGLESTLIKWFLGTATTVAGLAFAAARLVH